MKQSSTIMTVAKIIACILIVSYLTNTSMAAPLDNQQQRQQKAGSQEKKHQKNKMVRFSDEDVKMWTNSCGAESMMESTVATVDANRNFKTVNDTINVLDYALKDSIKINATNYEEAWNKFHGHKYEFLPTKPTGDHRKWHYDMQIFVASFTMLYKNQNSDNEMDNKTISEELKDILKEARELLCAIEQLVNATSAERIGPKDWVKKKEMRQIVKFQNLTEMLIHRIYAKGRLQDYVKKLAQRIETQSRNNYVEKKITYPKLRAFGRNNNKNAATRKSRKGNRRPQNGRRTSQQYEVTPTKRVHIVRTSKMPTEPRNNKNRLNRRRQRTRTTTTTVASV